MIVAFLVITVTLLLHGGGAAQASHDTAWHGYDDPALLSQTVTATPSQRLSSAAAFGNSFDRSAAPRRLFAELVAPNSTGSRFVVNGAGDVLDSARVTIPEGKFGYLLEDPSKAGVFGNGHPGAMGFAPDSLDTALRIHIVDNFGSATSSVPWLVVEQSSVSRVR